MDKRETLLVAQYKQREKDRLSDYVLNQMSIIENGLIAEFIIFPSEKEIDILKISMIELRKTILTPEERNALNEI